MGTSHKVWVLEDEADARDIYKDILGESYSLIFFESLSALRGQLKTTHVGGQLPPLLLADLRLPDGHFLDCFHEQGLLDGLNVVVVSSLDDMKTLKDCYAAGALDYLTKPFSKNELLVKIERLLTTKTGGGCELDPIKHVLRRNGHSTPALTSKEFQMMSLFQSSGESEVSRTTILEKIWGNVTVSAKTLDVHLFNLRKKIAEVGLEIVFVQPSSYQLKSKAE
jgi:DNA-binding response OmpR family regulator